MACHVDVDVDGDVDGDVGVDVLVDVAVGVTVDMRMYSSREQRLHAERVRSQVDVDVHLDAVGGNSAQSTTKQHKQKNRTGMTRMRV